LHNFCSSSDFTKVVIGMLVLTLDKVGNIFGSHKSFELLVHSVSIRVKDVLGNLSNS